MSKKEKIRAFDPNNPGSTSNNIFGLPFTSDEADIIIIPVPWEVTVSYKSGTAGGPRAVLDASYQVDLYDPFVPDAWKAGIAMDVIPSSLIRANRELRKKTEPYISLLEKGKDPLRNSGAQKMLKDINAACEKMNQWVKMRALHFMEKGKLIGLLGGDHSTPLGLLQALAEKYRDFGILQVDAHADLRKAYEGFTYSHASIMYNAVQIKEVKKLVQAGIRDYCEEEVKRIQRSAGKITTFFDRDIKHRQYRGENWDTICGDIIAELPDKVYLSFDIDGLDPKLCPHTGTPVPGGFEAEQVVYLIQKLVESGRQLIAFDINEVAPGRDAWDAGVGARLLYRIACLLARSNNKA